MAPRVTGRRGGRGGAGPRRRPLPLPGPRCASACGPATVAARLAAPVVRPATKPRPGSRWRRLPVEATGPVAVEPSVPPRRPGGRRPDPALDRGRPVLSGQCRLTHRDVELFVFSRHFFFLPHPPPPPTSFPTLKHEGKCAEATAVSVGEQ